MATGLAAQAAAAILPAFVARVEAAAAATALAIYSEATTLAGSLASGVAVTSVSLSAALGSAIPAATVVLIGGEAAVVAAGGAAQGATAIPVNSFTPTRVHPAGEVVSPPTVVGHAARAGLANAALNNAAGYAPRFAWALASQGVDNASLDADISTGLASVWNAVAGA
jgi:hypothetical protein